MKCITTILFAVLLITSCNTAQNKTTEQQSNTTTMDNLKTTAKKAQQAFFGDYDAEGVKTYFKTDYIQHNPHVPTGIAPVLGFLPVLEKAQTTYTTHRILQDGDFIVFHNSYNNAEAFGAINWSFSKN